MTIAASDRGWFEHLSGDGLRLLSGAFLAGGALDEVEGQTRWRRGTRGRSHRWHRRW
ncbi:MAG: hypothetical protein KY452_00450 [Actinobacteria bacterium]|nr:hypothetical protein [Actinomycetota bacterium]